MIGEEREREGYICSFLALDFGFGEEDEASSSIIEGHAFGLTPSRQKSSDKPGEI